MSELVPEFQTAWVRPTKSDPQGHSSALDPSTWGFYVPLARPTDWLAGLSIERVEHVAGPGGGQIRLQVRARNEERLTADFDPDTNYLAKAIEWTSPDGSAVTRTEVSYRPCPGRSAWLPDTSTTWRWGAGKGRSADKADAGSRLDHRIEKITDDPTTPASVDLDIPQEYRVTQSVGRTTFAEQQRSPATVMELVAQAATPRPTGRASIGILVAVNLVLLAGFLITRKWVVL